MQHKVLGNNSRGLLFVISAPAGTGKTTLVDMLVKEFPDAVTESCSCTTRPPRPSEQPKQHYEFLSLEEFERRIVDEEFIEYARVFGHYYGTLYSEIEMLQQSKKHVVLVIDTQGALQVLQKIPAISIFIAPPSLDELRCRLFKRRTETEAHIQERLAWAQEELKRGHLYNYKIVNDDLATSYQVLRSIFIAEEHKVVG